MGNVSCIRCNRSPVGGHGPFAPCPGFVRFFIRLVTQVTHYCFNALTVCRRQSLQSLSSWQLQKGVDVAHHAPPFDNPRIPSASSASSLL